MNNKILLIVESPNKLRTLQSFLPSNYTVMASVGHISEIKNGGEYFNTGIDPKNKFKTNYVVSQDKRDTVEKLKVQVEKSDKVIIASDPDREGEAIAWSLKKFLKIPNEKYQRVTFHEITKNAVLKALQNPRTIDNDLVLAAQARQKLDKLLGYRLSPIASKQVHAKSVGRCQSAGLKLIVQREEEIQAFNSETYYELYLYFNKNNREFKAKYIGDETKDIKKITSIEDANRIIDECNGPFVIDSIETKEKLNYSKPPFITSTFQQEVSSKLGIGVQAAQAYAQKLFEGIDINGQHVALITYIRTDSTDMSEDFKPLLEQYVKDVYGNEYYTKLRDYKKGENVQDGHECIRPVDLSMTPELLSQYIHDDRLLKVYDIIYKRTIATMMKPQKISETSYIIKDVSGGHRFEFISKEELFDGYKKVYNYKEDKDDDEIVKETFTKNEKINATGLDSQEKHTNPPSRYKEATFIKELESKGIGRPSTFASIVDTLTDIKRGYCTIVDNYIVPTPLGIELSHFLDKTFPDLISITYTSELEKDLDLIANGKLNDVEFLTEFYNKMESLALQVKSATQSTKAPVEYSETKCPECGAKMIIRTNSKNGNKFLGCSRFPKCKCILSITGGNE